MMWWFLDVDVHVNDGKVLGHSYEAGSAKCREDVWWRHFEIKATQRSFVYIYIWIYTWIIRCIYVSCHWFFLQCFLLSVEAEGRKRDMTPWAPFHFTKALRNQKMPFLATATNRQSHGQNKCSINTRKILPIRGGRWVEKKGKDSR